jgi:hypothetical protein
VRRVLIIKNKLKTNLNLDWHYDKYFDIVGIETYSISRKIHILDDVFTYFDKEKLSINIFCDDEDYRLAFYMCYIRITDLFFTWTYTKINKTMYDKVDLFLNHDKISNTLTIQCSCQNSFSYASSVLLYKKKQNISTKPII